MSAGLARLDTERGPRLYRAPCARDEHRSSAIARPRPAPICPSADGRASAGNGAPGRLPLHIRRPRVSRVWMAFKCLWMPLHGSACLEFCFSIHAAGRSATLCCHGRPAARDGPAGAFRGGIPAPARRGASPPHTRTKPTRAPPHTQTHTCLDSSNLTLPPHPLPPPLAAQGAPGVSLPGAFLQRALDGDPRLCAGFHRAAK